ncbi:MAG TPA: non-canonical purine NTP pyrophosphatase [Verrucomicrobiae bacterium]|nr:non-canonical purine NTP pyrophosphatase [Verrucomicrobiae bacterium]
MSETPLLIATRNAHKTGEIRALLGDRFRLLTLNDFPEAPRVIEDAPTFAGNATKKAVELAKWLAEKHSTFNIQHSMLKFVLADDSGLEVDALNGAPGVHSARFAALDSAKSGNTPDADNNAKLLRLLKDVPLEKRTARFHCVIALTPVLPEKVEVAPDVPERREGSSPVCYADEFEMQTRLFDGVCEGRMIFEPRGKNGFGYDPLFVPVGFEQTFAELGADTKNKLSHRARALQKLREYFGGIR